MDQYNQFKIGYRKNLCDKFDWRIAHIGNLESELKKVPGNYNTYDWNIGDVFKLSETFKSNKKTISIISPNMTALYLNIANNHFKSGRELLKNGEKSKNGYIHFEEKYSFDILENIIISIVFSISALEVFFNQHLSKQKNDDVILTQELGNGDKKDYQKIDIERYTSIEDKILHILPLFYKIDKKNLQKIEDKFKNLINLRNRLIHLKSIDLKPNSDIKVNTIWKILFDQLNNNPATISKEIINIFYTSGNIELPRWFRLIPF